MYYQCADALETKDSKTICDAGQSCKKWTTSGWSAEWCARDRAAIVRAAAHEASEKKLRDETLAASEAKESACRNDVKCWGEKASSKVETDCIRRIEGHAQYQHKWDSSWLDPKLTPQMWSDKGAGIVVFTGNKILMQNGFGAWQRQRYFCTIDVNSQTLIGVEVRHDEVNRLSP